MKKIIFNDKYHLTQAVLDGRKTQTRRVLNPTMFFKRMKTYEGWSKEDISAWKKSCNRRLYEAQGDKLQQMLDYALLSSRYKIGEEVAIAQAYRVAACNVDYSDKKIEEVDCSKGWKNKMFVKAELMPHRIRITNIRAERLQYITDEECLAEGIWKAHNVGLEGVTYWYTSLINSPYRTAKKAYAALMDKISGKGTWASNPYVFVYEFELVK